MPAAASIEHLKGGSQLIARLVLWPQSQGCKVTEKSVSLGHNKYNLFLFLQPTLSEFAINVFIHIHHVSVNIWLQSQSIVNVLRVCFGVLLQHSCIYPSVMWSTANSHTVVILDRPSIATVCEFAVDHITLFWGWEKVCLWTVLDRRRRVLWGCSGGVGGVGLSVF